MAGIKSKGTCVHSNLVEEGKSLENQRTKAHQPEKGCHTLLSGAIKA